MPWFKFNKDFDWRPKPKGGGIVAYKSGMHLNIPEAAADAAVAAGAGEKSKHQPKAGDRTDGTQAVRPAADGTGIESLEGASVPEDPQGTLPLTES